jgi:hypothetical protein
MTDTYLKSWEQIDGDVRRGRQQAKSMRVIFAGLVRNAEGAVRSSYEMLRRIGVGFKDYKFLVFENDSQDNTVKLLGDIANQDPRFEFRTKTFWMSQETGLEKSRMQRMATLRNIVRDWVRDFVRSTYQWDLIVVYDFDLNAFGPHVLSPHSFFGALGRRESMENGWDMLCANSLRHVDNKPTTEVGMYDCFAFRDLHNDSFNQPDCGYTLSKVLFSQYDLIPVHSCFGGLAMYRPGRFFECQYDPGVYDCEHVPFHKCMRQKGSEGRMFMDPLLTTSYDKWIKMGCYPDAKYARTFHRQDAVLSPEEFSNELPGSKVKAGNSVGGASFPSKARCSKLLADSKKGEDVCDERLADKKGSFNNALQCMSFCTGSSWVQWVDGGECQCYGPRACEITGKAASLRPRTRLYKCSAA